MMVKRHRKFAPFFLLMLVILVNTSRAQVFHWAKSIGGIESDVPGDIQLDAAGNIYLSGIFRNSVDFDPGIGTHNLISTTLPYGDIFILKLSPTGVFRWVKKITGNYGGMSVDATGNVFTTGNFIGSTDLDPGPGTYVVSSTGGGSYLFINKLDSSGNFLWGTSLGAWGASCSGVSLIHDSYSNICIAGSFGPTSTVPINVDFDPGSGIFLLSSIGQSDAFLLKLNSSGSFLWAKSFGGIFNDGPRAMYGNSNGEFFLTGTFEGTCDLNPDPGSYFVTSIGPSNTFVSKFDSLGNFSWGKALEGGLPSSVHDDLLGNVYVSGYFSGSPDFDPGPSNYSVSSFGGIDSYLLKLDHSGSFKWVRSFGGAGHDFASCSQADSKGNIFITGSFSGTVDFDPGTNTSYQTSTGWYDTYILKLDSSGNYIFAKALQGIDSASAVFPESFALSSNDEVFLTGSFLKTVDFDPGYLQSNLTSNGVYDFFILKLGACNLVLGRDSVITACKGENITLSTNVPAIYNWNPGSISTGSLNFIADSNITYTLVGYLSPECSDTLNFEIQVSNCLGYDSNKFVSENLLRVFPNPGNGQTQIQGDREMQIILTDGLGRTLLTTELKAEAQFSQQIEILVPGVYCLITPFGSKKLVILD